VSAALRTTKKAADNVGSPENHEPVASTPASHVRDFYAFPPGGLAAVDGAKPRFLRNQGFAISPCGRVSRPPDILSQKTPWLTRPKVPAAFSKRIRANQQGIPFPAGIPDTGILTPSKNKRLYFPST
jgi:hypothetical protein